MKKIVLFLLSLLPCTLHAQQLSPLTVEKIMRDPEWIGSSPSDVFWSPDSKTVYFSWAPEQAPAEKTSSPVKDSAETPPSDSLYYITLKDHTPRKVAPEKREMILAERDGHWNSDRTRIVFVQDQTIFLLDAASGARTKLLQSAGRISDPEFGFHNTSVIYKQDDNLYARDLKTGTIEQLTDFSMGKAYEKKEEKLTPQEQFLQDDALHNSIVLRKRKAREKAHEEALKAQSRPQKPRKIYTGDQKVTALSVSPDGRFIGYNLTAFQNEIRHTLVPDYVTSSGYTENIPGRPVAGVRITGKISAYIYDREKDSVYEITTGQIPGIRDLPDYVKDYPVKDSAGIRIPPLRRVRFSPVLWNAPGSCAVMEIFSEDHKDRWLMLLDPAHATLKLLDRQRDEAWVGWGPGIDFSHLGWVDENTLWYQSEKTGYSHLYAIDVRTGKKRALTSGKYEIQEAKLSRDKSTFYLSANRTEPGQKQFYQLDFKTGNLQQITAMRGGNRVTVAPDGKNIAFLYSTATVPWELYIQANKPGSEAARITDKAESEEYKSYPWREPEIFTFKDRDGLDVYAEVYRPEKPAPSRPGIMFVHGAGYLQDVGRWWSYYFREHLFMNMLADRGYTVMNVDYRGSAGYGRDWRTAIYRHMGSNDLEDILDGAGYMVKTFGVNPKKIGLWGGSYGGFLTLMAMCKSTVFACGGALRSVTDWAHYNDGYTSSILNEPQQDSLAYVRSSPIYFAEGLTGNLLMCHGMVDTNVHFQDIVRFTQKLIERGKKNWELAVYPLESHDFREPSSWTDEYNRIYHLFETNLK